MNGNNYSKINKSRKIEDPLNKQLFRLLEI